MYSKYLSLIKRTSLWDNIPINLLDDFKACGSYDSRKMRIVYRGPREKFSSFTHKCNATAFSVYPTCNPYLDNL
jgi:hypothetical protein